MKQILLATRPLVPPWDEASKNFAYFLAKSINAHHVSILTTPAWLPDLPANITQIPCYTKNELDFSEKMRLLSTLRNLRGKFDITHYLFTPTRKNTSLINFFSRPTHGKTLQTIATLREDLYGPKQWKQLLFAHHIVVYSDYSKKLLQNIGFHNVSRIYPGVDLSFYQPAEKNTQTLEYRAKKQILVAMREATKGESFDKIITSEFEEIVPPEARFLTACVALTTEAGFTISKQDFVGFSDSTPAETLFHFSKYVNIKLL